MKEIKLKKPKICSCGKIHLKITWYKIADNNDGLDGIYFNCSCRQTTLFIPASEKDEYYDQEAAA